MFMMHSAEQVDYDHLKCQKDLDDDFFAMVAQQIMMFHHDAGNYYSTVGGSICPKDHVMDNSPLLKTSIFFLTSDILYL